MRIGFIGTGALGGVYAGHLAANGEDVRCFDIDEDIIASIDENGLHVERPGREDLVTHPPASTDPAELGEVDVAFVLTKAIDTAVALQSAEAMLGPETRVITVQNGLLNMRIVSEQIPEERVLGGYSRLGANTAVPGRVQQLGNNETVIGGQDYKTAGQVAERLNDAGLEALAVEDPEPYIWDKNFTNVALKPLASLSEIRNGPMIEYEETRAAMRRLIEEAMEVAEAKGVEILADDPVAMVIDRELDEAGYRKKSSILEDVENRRPTEIQHINGAVTTLGEEVGVDTPYNRIVTQLMTGKERGYLEGPPGA